MESGAAEDPSEIQMHAVAEPVSRVTFPRKPPDASQRMGTDASESKRERQEQVHRSNCMTALHGLQALSLLNFLAYFCTLSYNMPTRGTPQR